MSTLVSYLLAVILQFIGISAPKEKETALALTHQQCEEKLNKLPNSFIINNEQELKTEKKEY